MKLDNMFNRKTTDLVRVPEIEVYDDRVEVHRSDPEQERQSSPERDPETRSYRLPKTTWFGERG